MQALANFVSKWSHPDYPTEAVLLADLEEAEAQLGTRLPRDYRDAVLTVGLPLPSVALLHSVCEQEADFDDVSEFLATEEMVASTKAWLPKGKIAFASDCMGNLFAFDSASLSESSEVWFFDHDTGETSVVASSFEHWIQRYLDLEFIPLDD